MATARQLPSGTYRCVVYIGKDSNGKKKYKSFTDKDKRHCERIASEYADTHRIVKTKGTFGDAMTAYLNAKKAVLSPSTIKGYKSIERYIQMQESAFYALRIGEIDRDVCQRFINHMVDADMSPKSVRNYYGLVSTVLEYHGHSVGSVRFPEKKKPELSIPDTNTVLKIIDSVKGTEMEIPVMLAAFAPLRRSEICGLSIDDIDGNIIHVQNAVVSDGEGNYVTKGTKTYDSDRYIPMPRDIIDKIMAQGYVTKLKNPDVITSRFERIVKKLGCKGVRFHDLRHWCASYLHAKGVPDQYIMARGGWRTDAVMKAVYRHELASEKNKWNKEIDKMFASMRKIDSN